MQAPAHLSAGVCTLPLTHPLETYCAIARDRGLDLTPLRLEVLKALWRSNGPMGAYGIAKQLTRPSARKAYANSVYRTLHTLADAGLIVPIVSWKRFIISPDPRRFHWTFNLCGECGSLACLPMGKVADEIASMGAREKFKVHRIHIECMGLCRACMDKPDSCHATIRAGGSRFGHPARL